MSHAGLAMLLSWREGDRPEPRVETEEWWRAQGRRLGSRRNPRRG